jgi:phosphatidylserine decarboxylase
MLYLNPIFCLYSLFVRAASKVYVPTVLRPFVYKSFGKFGLKMSSLDFKESGRELYEFSNISEFFSIPINAKARPIGNKKIVSPCDGKIIEQGKIIEGTIIRVKGTNYCTKELLQDELLSAKHKNGSYINIYLSPKNYHRFHIPCEGKITHIQHIPGYCLPVNKLGRKVNKLYSLNERVIVQISNSEFSVCLAIVGAAAVRGIKIFKVVGDTVHKGDILGMFELGSSIVVLTDTNMSNIKINAEVKACSNI